MDYEAPTSPSLKNRVRSSACLSCCFRSSAGGEDQLPPSLLRSSSTWLRSKARDLPEMKEKFGTLISRIGKSQRRGQLADFRYDPLSYALNFDEGNGADDDDGEVVAGEEVRYRNFSARLPPSPPNAVSVAYG